MAFGSSVASAIGGGGGNYVGGSIVRLLLDAAQFESGLKSSEARMHAFGRRVSSVGRGMTRFGASMTRNVTVPVVAAAAASVKMAVDFESAFTRIRANSNLTNKEIDKLRGVVLDLAGKTAKSPQELAEGLYFLASAGLNARQVQETLTMAAKASAAGFGEVGDIARLTANALNAYAAEGLKAKEVTDTLAAGVREGTAEPEEFANALGRILPFASKAKVGFDEVVASLASLSNIGLDVNEGVTAMRGLMSGLLAPTKQAADALEEIGLSADEVRRSLAEDGLLATMRLLEDRTGGNIDMLKKIIPNIRALVGQFGVTSQEADKVDASFRRVIGATGDLDKAFRTTKKDPGFQMKQLLSELQVLAIEVGQDALPVLKDVAQAIRDGIKWFRELPKPMQDSIVKWGLLAAAIGPIVGLLGRIVTLGGKAIGVIGRLGAGAAAAGGAAGAAGAGGGVAGAAAKGGIAARLGGAVAAHPVAAGVTVLALVGTKNALDDIAKQRAAERTITEFGVASRKSADAVRKLGLDLDILEKQWRAVQDARARGVPGSEKGPDSAEYRQRIAETRAELARLERKHLDYLKAQVGSEQAAREYSKMLQVGADLSDQQRGALGKLVAKMDQYGATLTVTERAEVLAAIAAGRFKDAVALLNGQVDTARNRMRDAKGTIDGFQGAVDTAATKVINLRKAMHSIPSRLTTTVHVDTVQAHAALYGLRSAFSYIPPSLTVNAVPKVSDKRAHGGPVQRGKSYLVGEKGPEIVTMGGDGNVTPNYAMRGGVSTVEVHANGKTLTQAVTLQEGRNRILLGGRA